jgi:hypothetical protein
MSEVEKDLNDSSSEPTMIAGSFAPPQPPITISDKQSPHMLETAFNILMKILPFVFLAVVYIYFSSANERFTESRNIDSILRQATYFGFIAVGLSAVMLCGKVDFSSLGLLALVAYSFVDTANESSVNLWWVGYSVCCIALPLQALGCRPLSQPWRQPSSPAASLFGLPRAKPFFSVPIFRPSLQKKQVPFLPCSLS